MDDKTWVASADGTQVALDNVYLETEEHNHRLYQSYALENLAYLAPMDEDEIERLNISHNVLSRVFDGRLIFPPISRPRRILDCGYGTGAWAGEVAERFPRCEVLGVDINPSMQQEEVPDNLYLQVDDLNRRFTFPAHNFDLVNSQMMASSIHANRWPQYLRDMFRVTRPGGWCQMVEMYFQVQSDNGSLTDDHALRQWSTRYAESMEGLKDLRVPLRLSNMMRDAGFVDVEARMIQLPTCGWSNEADMRTEQRDHDIGVANRENVQRLLSSLAVYPFTERLGMPIQDVHLLVAQARLEADEPGFKAYFPLYVCIGRKSRSRR
ncbi:UMTA methyltransferase [Mollisia scopiformis]|uniref:UMTA methyltransferase n=1 Tax=Mollisia scopiformis TaxID=149040 RepID=A0A132B1U8_MOLSC|nr:UMTA methyltransferase [Mollisia scopiformis]KUJ06271.1 UMTA methyltransferase [Mollisia scopiformis]